MKSVLKSPASRLRRVLKARRDERGAYAILMSMTLVLVIALAAIAVDISSQVTSRQTLKDTMDAAAHTAAYELGNNPSGAAAAARAVAQTNDPSANPNITFWCVVASTGDTKAVVTAQIPGTCNPGPGLYTTAKYPGLVCDEVLCFIPCVISSTTKCNTIRISDEKTVPFDFAPAIGVKTGKTGAVTSVACNGACGKINPNPLDIVVVADRTASMETADRQQMKSAILGSLKLMDTKTQYVAFGTIHKSRTTGFTSKANTYGPQTDDYAVTGTSDSDAKYNYNGHWDGQGKTQPTSSTSICRSEASSELSASSATPPILRYGSKFTWNSKTWGPYTAPDRVNSYAGVDDSEIIKGTWIPVPFTKDYLLDKTLPEDPSVLNNNSNLVDSISCLPQSVRQEYGTNLASAMKESVRYAFSDNPEPNRVENVKVRKVIIFETDGQPSEPVTFGNTLLTSGDVGNKNGVTGCENLKSVATAAKNLHKQNLVIITIGFGDAATAKCGGSGATVRSVLASAASEKPGGGASDANTCQGSDIAKENGDGDYFFCATDGSDLESIFATAFTSVSGKIRLLKMPG